MPIRFSPNAKIKLRKNAYKCANPREHTHDAKIDTEFRSTCKFHTRLFLLLCSLYQNRLAVKYPLCYTWAKSHR